MYNFKLEGTFLEKPVLTLEGVPIPYQTLSASYFPMETVDGPDGKITAPEFTSLQFSLSSKVGNLESNTLYRVKANKDGQLTFEQLPKEVKDALQQFITEARKMKRPPHDEKKEDPEEEKNETPEEEKKEQEARLQTDKNPKTGRCPDCGKPMKDGKCPSCGAKAAKTCSECGTVMKDGECPKCSETAKAGTTCLKCGAPLDPKGNCPQCSPPKKDGPNPKNDKVFLSGSEGATSTVALLNKLRAAEITSAMQYELYSIIVPSLHLPGLQDIFAEHEGQEWSHSDALAQRIHELGGEPISDLQAIAILEPFSVSHDVKPIDMVSTIRMQEETAVNDYKEAIAQCQDDPATRLLLEGILQTEEEHLSDMRSMLESNASLKTQAKKLGIEFLTEYARIQ